MRYPGGFNVDRAGASKTRPSPVANENSSGCEQSELPKTKLGALGSMHLFDLAGCCECFLILHQSNLLYINKTKVVYMLSSPTCIFSHRSRPSIRKSLQASPVTGTDGELSVSLPHRRNLARAGLARPAQPAPGVLCLGLLLLFAEGWSW